MVNMFRPVAPPPPPDLTGGFGRPRTTPRRPAVIKALKVLAVTGWVVAFAFMALVLFKVLAR